jgi:hypothetical protein
MRKCLWLLEQHTSAVDHRAVFNLLETEYLNFLVLEGK